MPSLNTQEGITVQSITINEAVQRIQALQQFSEESGVKLPFRAGFIIGQELRGHLVDLETGAITLGGASQRFGPTASGTISTDNGGHS